MALQKVNSCGTQYKPTVYKGVTFSLPFTYKQANGVPYDLTGKSVVAKFKTLFGATTLEITETPTTLGSYTLLTDAVNGQFLIFLTDEETDTLEETSGTWWIELHDGGDVRMLYYGNIAGVLL